MVKIKDGFRFKEGHMLRVQCSLTQKQFDFVKDQATKYGSSFSSVLRIIITDYMDEKEKPNVRE